MAARAARGLTRTARPAMPRRPSPAGFTLVELTITLVVLGIAAGLALPALSGLLAREGEKSASRVIQGILRRAQAEALLTGRDWRVDIDWARGECRARPGDPPPEPVPGTAGKDDQPLPGRAVPTKEARDTGIVTPLPGNARPRLVLTAQATLTAPDAVSIVLRPVGLCQPAFLRLPGEAGKDLAITIAAVGCRVELWDSDLDERQQAFRKAHGLLDLPWADAVPTSRS